MREPSLHIDPSYRAGLPELTGQEGYGESEDNGLVRDAVASMEARHERAVRLRLVSKHQNEWEEFGVLNAGDGHPSGAKGSRDGDRTRDQGGARTRRLRSSRGLRKRLVLKKTTLRMRTMLLLPAPPTSAGVCVLLLYSTSSGYKKGKEGAGGPGSGPFVKDAVDEAPFGSEGVRRCEMVRLRRQERVGVE
jgi:hypothetical protein